MLAAETTILRDRPMRGRACEGSRTCAFGVLERPGVDGGEPIVKAKTAVATQFPPDDSPVEDTFIYTLSWSGTRLDGPLAMPTGSYTVPIEPAAMTLADALPIGSVIAAEGWLSQIGDEAACGAPADDSAESLPVTSPFVSCPAGWLTPEPVDALDADGLSPLDQFGIGVQPIAVQRARGDPSVTYLKRTAAMDASDAEASGGDSANPVRVRLAPESGTYLLRSKRNSDPEGQPAVGWSVIGRLDPVDLPGTPGAVTLPAGAAPAGLAWVPVPEAHPPLDGPDIQVVSWAGGFASIQKSPDGLLTAWSSPDGHHWERAPLPRSIRRVRSLLPLRDGLVLMTNPRNSDPKAASFALWRSDDGLAWKRTGSLRIPVPRRYRGFRQLLHGPWTLDDRLVMLTSYTDQACCGSAPSIFLAAPRRGGAGGTPVYRASAWVSRDGHHWTERPTRGLNSVQGGAGEHIGYLEGYQDGEVLATFYRSESLGRSTDGLRWLTDVPLPESFDDSSPAVVARTPDGFVLAGEAFDGGPGPGNWLTVWQGTEDGIWTRVYEHGQRSPDAIVVSGSIVIIAGEELDPATADDDENVRVPWIEVSTDGGTTWDESLAWTGTVPMCPNGLTAHGETVVLTFGCAPPGMATTFVAELGSLAAGSEASES